jgi:hypothetical protein
MQVDVRTAARDSKIKQVLGGPLEAGASTEARQLQWQHFNFRFYSTSPLLLFLTA